MCNIPPPPNIPPHSTARGLIGYLDLNCVGKGGFGEVFKGHSMKNSKPDKFFAFKRALPYADTSTDIEELIKKQKRRFDSLRREAQVYFSATFNTGACHHLVLLHEIAMVSNSNGIEEPLLVMQWADGPCSNLKDWLRLNTKTSDDNIRQRLSFAIQMCAGLRQLHTDVAGDTDGTGLVFAHQDLKPDNILLFKTKGRRIRLALTDFGLTVRCNSGDHVFGGTRAYMAPEQLLHQPALTPGRDMWAAGLILTKLLGGDNATKAVRNYQIKVSSINKFDMDQIIQLCTLAREIAHAISLDAAATQCGGGDAPTTTGDVTENIHLTRTVQFKMQTVLLNCFDYNPSSKKSKSSVRITSEECERRLIKLWDGVFPKERWQAHWATLSKPSRSRLKGRFNTAERQAMFNRSVEAVVVRLMLRHCEDLYKTAKAEGGDSIKLERVFAALQKHKCELRKQLFAALQSACGHIESVLSAAKIHPCNRCGQQWPGTPRVPGSMTVRVPASDPNPSQHGPATCFDCRYVFSWLQKGLPIGGFAQQTQLVLIRGELWEETGCVLADERDEVVASFVQAQTMWCQVYNGVKTDKQSAVRAKRLGIAVGVSKDTRSTKDRYSPLMLACERGLRLLVEEVLDNPDNHHWVNKAEPGRGWTPLMLASLNGRTQTTSVLLNKCRGTIDVDKAHNDGITPVSMASVSNHVDVLTLLLQSKADPNKADNDGTTSLLKASENNHVEAVALLLQSNAHPNKARNDGTTPLYKASENNHVEIVTLLLQSKALPNKARNDGTTPLYKASEHNQVEVMTALLQSKADPDKSHIDGTTPVSIASYKTHVDALTLLLQLNADPNKANNMGRTPYYWAYRKNDIQVMAMLIHIKADPDMCSV